MGMLEDCLVTSEILWHSCGPSYTWYMDAFSCNSGARLLYTYALLLIPKWGTHWILLDSDRNGTGAKTWQFMFSPYLVFLKHLFCWTATGYILLRVIPTTSSTWSIKSSQCAVREIYLLWPAIFIKFSHATVGSTIYKKLINGLNHVISTYISQKWRLLRRTSAQRAL